MAGEKKTEQRCSDPEVAANCPLTCGECSTAGLFAGLDSTVVIPLQGTIPTDDDEALVLFKNTLIQALYPFFSSSSSASSVVVTDVQLVLLTNARGAVNTNFDAELNISADISCNPNCATAQTVYEETATSVALEIYTSYEGNVLFSDVTIRAGEELTVSTTATQIGQTTAVPTTPPSLIPTQGPSNQASLAASIKPSAQPTVPPTKTPTTRPTNGPIPYIPFTTKNELEAEVDAYCEDPDTYDTSTYGYVFCTCCGY